MRAAMASAEVGDDVYGDDPTVNRLEAAAAAKFDKEAALFVSSGTQSNLVAMLAHCGRGEEVITGFGYHTFTYEAAGASVLGGIALHPIPPEADGGLDPDKIRTAVKPDDSHHPISRLLSLENTHYGKAIPLERIQAAVTAGREAGLMVHLDGARFFNAVTALKIEPAALAELFDTVSICLSKGLGSPAGSVLVGPADAIARARRWRKMLGGGLRQAGVLAAAGLQALEQNVAGLAEDHRRAEILATALREYGQAWDAPVAQATNMVFITPKTADHAPLRAHLNGRGLRLGGGEGSIRLVLHRDINDAKLDRAIDAFASFYKRNTLSA
ncbi:MAG: low-specificity L-threonine aldolase [Rhodobacteraceae bacterium]|nr:low-specificity L-threonine aldolase [Paracoccaceae bacterium]